MSLGLLILSACLTISLLHVLFPRQLAAAPKVIVPESAIVAAPKEEIPPEVVYSSPVRIEIPKLSIVAPVIPAGLTKDNAMDIGKDIEKTAWYKLGPKPGEKGSAVIAGHYGWLNNGQGSVFNNLHTLQAGDKISVYDEKGLTVNFVVRETRKYDLNADAIEVFRSTDEKAHLNLITCGGQWDYPHQTYSDRLVIFSDLET